MGASSCGAHVRLTYLFSVRVYRYGLPAPLTPLPEGSRGAAHGVSRYMQFPLPSPLR